MTTESPTFLKAQEAASALIASIKDPRAPLTIADASAQSGLALRDAEHGMHALTSEYRGHLRVSEGGDLVFVFPTGFTKPWETRDAIDRLMSRIGHAAMGAARFIVRAWVMIVLVGYALIFLAIVLGLMFAQKDDNRSSRNSGGGGRLAEGMFRILGDAMFWTFHPFSPFSVYNRGSYSNGYEVRRAAPRDETPFYEKVNRFLFGPTPKEEDPRAMEQRVLAQIRAKKGRIGLVDVMRVTGLPRDHADPLMARLMLDYEGDVSVSEEGAITYQFEKIRKTATEGTPVAAPPPAWTRAPEVPRLTGNSFGSNVAIALLNAFNGFMALFAIDNHFTLENLQYIFFTPKNPRLPFVLPDHGDVIALGYIPLLFSIALFFVPLLRALYSPIKARRISREKGRLALLREVLTRIPRREPVTDKALARAWQEAAGRAPSSKEINREVLALGGDVDLGPDAASVRYRFADIELTEKALQEERDVASEDEAKVGKIVFTSEQ